MSAEFIKLRQFPSEAEAEYLIKLLNKADIAFELEMDRPSFDPFFAYNTVTEQAILKVHPDQFDAARALIDLAAQEAIEHFDEFHPLYELSLEELYEILEKPDEWSREDVFFARKLLKERGRDVNEARIQEMYEKRLFEIRKTVRADQNWLYLGFFSAVLGLPLALYAGRIGSLFLFFPILQGILYIWAKKTDPEGRRWYMYDSWTRQQGKYLIFTAIASLVLWLLGSIFIPN